ncbi:type II toxin-antitoxin system ParD family antitoxin [Sphingomonas sp.]|jgi:Arc/MetJ-type ribon-helix-helix transcriptional regulator|uniref:ribbon-helix-helix domain-containing protein n=1 Tax=Sphingomonas sp. TaxID=28214 RepID=UPI002D7E67B1|nr:type II toxin-antitoxin system ParD family antitoxin [Sphingomonas sp.]HEU0045472.1 type II toxin-antitoxin system ParD family antitoxin [Sphingomonas sp.]
MSAIGHLTVKLPPAMADQVQAWVDTGDFADAEGVIRDALLAYGRPEDRHSDPSVEEWLRTKVVAAYDAHKRDPSRAVPLDQVVARLKTERMARGE